MTLTTRNRRRFGYQVVMTLAATVALVACGSTSETSSSPSDDTGTGAANNEGTTTEFEPLNLSLGMAVKDDVSGIPLVFAAENDIWKEYGLNVDLAYFQGGGALVQGLVGGNIDLGWVSHTAAINGYATGGEINISLETSKTGVGWGLVVAPDSPIQTVDDLAKGMSISVTSAGSLTDWFAQYSATLAGLKPSDITTAPIGTSLPTISTALAEGQVDAAVVLLPWGHTLVANNDARWVVKMTDVLPDFSFAGVAATPATASNERAIGCFEAAYADSLQRLIDDPDGTKEFMRTVYGIEDDVVDAIYDQLIPDFNLTGEPNIDRMQQTIDELGSVPGFLKEPVQASDLVKPVTPWTQDDCTSA